LHTKVREENEARYVSDYILERFPGERYKLRVPLGNAPERWIEEMGAEKALRSYRSYRPEADAIVITEEKMILIEGKIFRVMDGISKLVVYRFLIPDTPELSEYQDRPIETRLVTPQPPYWATRFADHEGIEIDMYEPDWIQHYKERYNRYWTSEERAERAKRREVLKGLGMR